MTADEQTCYDAGKLGRLMDERNAVTGSRTCCPYRVPKRARAWRNGYEYQKNAANVAAPTTEQMEAKRAFAAGIEKWLRERGAKT